MSDFASTSPDKRPLEELINLDEPAWPLVQEWIREGKNPCEALPPSEDRDAVLLELQITTRSPLGAIAYESGGILIDGGWIRILGSGHPRLTRTLPNWNEGRGDGFCLVADDAVGGFFAMNGGALGENFGEIYYLAPDDLEWIELGGSFSQFINWALSPDIEDFYSELRWDGWREDTKALPGDRCFHFYPPLWTDQGSISGSSRADVPIHEAWAFQTKAIAELTGAL